MGCTLQFPSCRVDAVITFLLPVVEIKGIAL